MTLHGCFHCEYTRSLCGMWSKLHVLPANNFFNIPQETQTHEWATACAFCMTALHSNHDNKTSGARADCVHCAHTEVSQSAQSRPTDSTWAGERRDHENRAITPPQTRTATEPRRIFTTRECAAAANESSFQGVQVVGICCRPRTTFTSPVAHGKRNEKIVRLWASS